MTKQKILSISMLSTLQAVVFYRLLYMLALAKGELFFYSPSVMIYWGIFYCVEVALFTLSLCHFFRKDAVGPVWNTSLQGAVFTSALTLMGSAYLEKQEGKHQLHQKLYFAQEQQKILQQSFIL